MSSSELPLFPTQTPAYILSFQFSCWYELFSNLTIKSTVIRPLSKEFHDYLDSDGVFVPEGSEDVPAKSTLSDDEDSDEDDEDTKHYAFPELDKRIRDCIQQYGAVFPKLNFTSPKDASWVLPASSPLKCTTPAEVYLLLKSSDFVTHDLHPATVFENCDLASLPKGQKLPYELELVLRKWYPVDRSRELRCFVRRNSLIGISQRDTNYYEFLNEPATREKIVFSVKQFWEDKIKPKWETHEDYTFDFLLTRDFSRGHILDFNPYSQTTDPLLFTYEDLQSLAASGNGLPMFNVIDSPAHPAASSNAPTHQHNMIPFEAVSMSSGKDIEEFAEQWKESIIDSIADDER